MGVEFLWWVIFVSVFLFVSGPPPPSLEQNQNKGRTKREHRGRTKREHGLVWGTYNEHTRRYENMRECVFVALHLCETVSFVHLSPFPCFSIMLSYCYCSRFLKILHNIYYAPFVISECNDMKSRVLGHLCALCAYHWWNAVAASWTRLAQLRLCRVIQPPITRRIPTQP